MKALLLKNISVHFFHLLPRLLRSILPILNWGIDHVCPLSRAELPLNLIRCGIHDALPIMKSPVLHDTDPNHTPPRLCDLSGSAMQHCTLKWLVSSASLLSSLCGGATQLMGKTGGIAVATCALQSKIAACVLLFDGVAGIKRSARLAHIVDTVGHTLSLARLRRVLECGHTSATSCGNILSTKGAALTRQHPPSCRCIQMSRMPLVRTPVNLVPAFTHARTHVHW